MQIEPPQQRFDSEHSLPGSTQISLVAGGSQYSFGPHALCVTLCRGIQQALWQSVAVSQVAAQTAMPSATATHVAPLQQRDDAEHWDPVFTHVALVGGAAEPPPTPLPAADGATGLALPARPDVAGLPRLNVAPASAEVSSPPPEDVPPVAAPAVLWSTTSQPLSWHWRSASQVPLA